MLSTLTIQCKHYFHTSLENAEHHAFDLGSGIASIPAHHLTDAEHGPIRLLLVGAGRMGRAHLRAISASQRVAAVAVVDPSQETRNELAGSELRLYDTLDAALRDGGFDAALIAAPSGLHLGIVETLVAAQIPTLCEKPCGLTTSQTRSAASLAGEMGVTLQVGYWRRYVPELVELRDEIKGGALGEIVLAQAWQWDGEPPAPNFRQSSGGILLDMGVHEFDQLRWLTGQEISLDSVVASDVFLPPHVDGDPESVLASGTLSGGGVAAISLGRRYDQGDTCWVEVIGTAGSRRCEFMSGPDGNLVFHRALVDQIDGFAAAIGGLPLNAATVADAVAALAIAERAGALLRQAE